MKQIIIALDGPAGSGKTSSAKEIAKRLSYTYIDTGAMYRAIALAWIRELEKLNLDCDEYINNKEFNNEFLTEIMNNYSVNLIPNNNSLKVILNKEDVTDLIRDAKVTKFSSPISAYNIVRVKLIEQQRQMGKNGGVVMDGRDIGTVVFPKAELKVFLIADIDARTERRYKELVAKGNEVDKAELKELISIRDFNDTNRESSPLIKADDAIELDTSKLTFNAQVNKIIELANNIINFQ